MNTINFNYYQPAPYSASLVIEDKKFYRPFYFSDEILKSKSKVFFNTWEIGSANSPRYNCFDLFDVLVFKSDGKPDQFFLAESCEREDIGSEGRVHTVRSKIKYMGSGLTEEEVLKIRSKEAMNHTILLVMKTMAILSILTLATFIYLTLRHNN